MNTALLVIGLVFVLLGLFFGSGGGLMVGSSFISLGLLVIGLGFVLGRGDTRAVDSDERERSAE